MSLPTVADLCASLRHDLVPAEGFAAPDLEVSAVHVSELADPTPFLSGGELLLTTGLSLPDNEIGCERYVSRLCDAGVTALGVGVGQSLSQVPDLLVRACARHGLCLLIVPVASAFLTVTKAYWTSRSRSTQQELSDALTAHRSLVNAMVSNNPVGEALRTLSGAIGAWVATLDPGGTVEHVYPSGRISDAMAITQQIARLRVAGMHSTATFPSGDDVVAVFPLPLEDRVVGYLAIGSPSRLSATDRRLVLTASALLSLDSVQRVHADSVAQAQRQAVAALLDMSLVDSARRLASRLALPALGESVRILVARSARLDDLVAAVQGWSASALPAPPEGDRIWFVVTDLNPRLDTLEAWLIAADPLVAAALSDVVAVTAVHDVRVGLFGAVTAMAPSVVRAPHTTELHLEDLHEGLQRVLGHSRADLGGALVAYLRHRGQWEPAARELGVHRNTLRHRITRTRELLGADLDEPDVAAELWLYLRRNGLA